MFKKRHITAKKKEKKNIIDVSHLACICVFGSITHKKKPNVESLSHNKREDNKKKRFRAFYSTIFFHRCSLNNHRTAQRRGEQLQPVIFHS